MYERRYACPSASAARRHWSAPRPSGCKPCGLLGTVKNGGVFTADVLRFVLLLLCSAAWLVVQVDLFRRTATASVLTPLQRVLCVVPPVATYYAYRLGARRRAVVSVLLLVAYVAIRSER